MTGADDRPRGSVFVALRVVLDLLLDVLSTPFHILAFVATRGRHKARFARMLADSREAHVASPSPTDLQS